MAVLTEIKIRANFTEKTYMRGWHYQNSGRVKRVVLIDHNLLKAEVQGSKRQAYKVTLVLEQHNSTRLKIAGNCSCPLGQKCKHIVATLLAAMKQQLPIVLPENTTQPNIAVNWITKHIKNNAGSNELKEWLKIFDNNSQAATVLPPVTHFAQNEHLIYVLRIKVVNAQPSLVLGLYIAKQLKRGGFGVAKTFSATNHTHYNALLADDHDILHQLEINKRIRQFDRHNYEIYVSEYEIPSSKSNILNLLLATKRCFWSSMTFFPASQDPTVLMLLRLGEAIEAKLNWSVTNTGAQRLSYLINEKEIIVLPMDPLWYLNPENGCIGPLQTKLEPALQPWLFAPAILPQETAKAYNIIKKQFPALPLPKIFKTTEIENVTIIPKLLLFGAVYQEMVDLFYDDADEDCNADIALCRISFNYNNVEIQLDDPQNIHIFDQNNHELQTITRQFDIERDHINFLLEKGIKIFADLYRNYDEDEIKAQDFLIGDIGTTELQRNFLDQIVPELQALGWIINIATSFPVEHIIVADDWYTKFDEASEYDWFKMELGITVNHESINILPLLVELLQKTPKMVNDLSVTNKYHTLQLKNGQKINLPTERIKGILAILTELYDEKSLNAHGQLLISRLRATQLGELKQAMQLTTLRWLGGKRLEQLQTAFKKFTHIKQVTIPKTFKGTLRDYQQHGVAWLGFLREYGLGGILADDMGLGKTVQTIAHLLIEKTAKRLIAPCLIIAPTSLVSNWTKEIAEFAPELQILVLHGTSRKHKFINIKTVDVVLTTYPLLARDKEVLLNQEYYLIVLDEAQYIKNSLTTAYQIIQQLRTRHRLCLTGTPMENNLGELWSLFNFLAPGLLGNVKQFNTIFRVPIEKQNCPLRKQSLQQRIYPFMLRRTKTAVVQELPAKTEIVQNIDLSDEQRDLYEGIRLSMETKIKQAVKAKGLNGSQIIILDALLKLRQACCDPRLLKLQAAKAIKHSVKLDFLLQMLEELISEGRKILLFSSFASMLELIGSALTARKIKYCKLIGSTQNREKPINEFQTGSVPIFLISLKAGGTGLNLTAADTVIHYDPWWNPAAEAQATDRAHRIGQTKPIFVYKLVTTGTVEEKILQMQQKKRELLDSLFAEGGNSKAGLTSEDLSFLLQPLEANTA